MDSELQALHEKLDYLIEQVEAQRQRQEIWDELLRDIAPAVNDMFQLAIDELDEISPHVELRDILGLVKRLLRDARLLNDMLDKLESLVELGEDLGQLSQPAFVQLVQKLDEMERKGYFAFVSEGMYTLDRVVSEFDREDVHALGDNIVTILKTVRSMTQPEVMNMVNSAVTHLEGPIAEDVSLWHLLRQLRDPEVRKGLARILYAVKGIAQPVPMTTEQ
ncbi:MAG: DUF1641 domain-containing protein [Aggregatilineales bacterium]